MQFNSMAELKNAANLQANTVVRTAGYYEPGDGGGAEYLVDAFDRPQDGGSVIDLPGGLKAQLLPTASVNYKQFGAVGDGVNDDSVQIKQAHEYANRKGLPIINLSGEFWLKETNVIPIRTNVAWGHTTFHIDERFNARRNPRFRVSSERPPVAITLEPEAKAAFLSKLKPGTTLLSELSDCKNSLVIVTDTNDRIGRRHGYGGHTWAREEMFYVEEHGRIIGDIAWTFRDYTSLTAYPYDDSYLVIEGGTFYMSGDYPGGEREGYVYNGFDIRRSRTIIRNQWVGLEPGRADVSLEPRVGFYDFNCVYDVQLENVRLIPWEQKRGEPEVNVHHGTYGIGGTRVLNATFRNVTAEGSDVHWGVFGTNIFKNFRVENCRLNRVDVHFHCWNLYVKDSEIGYKGFTLTGGGDLFIENTKRFGNQFLSFREDYGSKWDGNIRLSGCRLIVENGNHEAVALSFNPADFDYLYPVSYGRSIRVDDFIFDYTGKPDAHGVCRVMRVAPFSKTETGQRLLFPNRVEFRNVSVDGRAQGVRIMDIRNPHGFDLRKPGGYDEQQVVPNCYMRFENIQSEKLPPQSPQSAEHFTFGLRSLNGEEYEDEYALYPHIEFINCGDIVGHFEGAAADVSMNRCLVRSIRTGADEPMWGKFVFDNCRFQADAVDEAGDFLSLSAAHGVYFLHCTVHAPLVEGAARPELTGRYGFLKVNDELRFNHLGTKLAKEITDYYAATGDPVEPEYAEMLKSHSDTESIYMAMRRGTSAQRPEPYRFGSQKGFVYFDTDRNRPVIWDGVQWGSTSHRTETLHLYAAGLSADSAGTRMKRMEGHPSQEYVLTDAGRVSRYAAGAGTSASDGSPAFTFTITKNGEPWLTGLNRPRGAARTVIEPVAGDSSFRAGDRLGVTISGVDGAIGPEADLYATVDLIVEYTD